MNTSGSDTQSTLLLFSKSPHYQGAKTRLRKSGTLSEQTVQNLHKAFVFDTLVTAGEALLPLSIFWHPEIPELPDTLAPNARHFKQSGTDFAARIRDSMQKVSDTNPSGVILIGSDCPALCPETLKKADALIAQETVAIGPAPNNGFYLLGLPASVMRRDFSSCFEIEDQVAALKSLFTDCQTELLPALQDIDTAENCREFALWLSENPRPDGLQYCKAVLPELLRILND